MLVAFAVAPSRARAAEDDGTAQARAHYEMGLRLFDAREHDQALIEFDTANELKPRPAAVFMMAQCEYLLGRLKEARTHYQAYVAQSPDGEFVELAKDRIQSIDRRPGTFAINTVPDEVDVRIVSETDPSRAPVTGQAPNNFPVPRGRYRITVSKKNYVQQSRVFDIDLAETKPLFFKLDEIPARLEIETNPPGATLYVNGNRARNPYHQDVTPGHFEIIGEALDHDTRTLEFTLSPGERKLLTGPDRFRLSVHAAIGAAGAGRRVRDHRRFLRRRRGRRGDRQEPRRSERRDGPAHRRRWHRGRDRRRADRDAVRAALHSRQPRAVHHRRDLDRRRRRGDGRVRRFSRSSTARGTPDLGCPRNPGPVAVRSVSSCGPASSARFPGWRWV